MKKIFVVAFILIVGFSILLNYIGNIENELSLTKKEVEELKKQNSNLLNKTSRIDNNLDSVKVEQRKSAKKIDDIHGYCQEILNNQEQAKRNGFFDFNFHDWE